MKAIILVGGFGTRLQSVVKDIPKPMADINTKPFLSYLLDKLSVHGIREIILSVGYKQETIKEYFQTSYKGMTINYSSEDEPLGTGGAIKKAIGYLEENEEVLILNGDTFFDLDLKKFIALVKGSEISIALKPMKHFDRYGSVEVDGNNVISFKEKKFVDNGLINAGIYLVNSNFIKRMHEDIFSFELFLEEQKNIQYYIEDSYFIDIGIPQDYKKAQIDFKEMF